MNPLNLPVVLAVWGLAVCGGVSRLDAQEVPPLPREAEESLGGAGGEGDLSDTGTNVIERVSLEPIWVVETYAALNWEAWDGRVREWYDALGHAEEPCLYPPTPPQMVLGIGQPLQELPSVFTAITNTVPAVLAEGVPTWGVNVREQVDEATGTRQFLTVMGHHVVHASPVSSTFDPEAWSLRVYNNGEALPEWIANDAEARATWFQLRGRERFGMACTFVAPGRLEELEAALQMRALLEREAAAAEQREPRAFSFTKIDIPNPKVVAFGFYNPLGEELGLLTQEKLGETWDYRGRVPMSRGQEYVSFPFHRLPENDPHFFKMINLSVDSDGDGLPDGLELSVFKTDPQKRDTTDCGMDDWSKIYLYGLDPTIDDNDHDGILDGDDELPGVAGPSITFSRPLDGEVYTVGATGTASVVIKGVVSPVTQAGVAEGRQLAALWIHGVNKVAYDQWVPFDRPYAFTGSCLLKPGTYSIVVEAEQAGKPRIRSRKFVNITVQPRGPEFVIVEPGADAQLDGAHLAVKVHVEKKDTTVWCDGHKMQSNNYYRFHILHFTETDLNQTKTIRLKAVAPTGEETTKVLKVTIRGLRENEIFIDHILNTGPRIFDGALDGITLGPEDFSEDGKWKR